MVDAAQGGSAAASATTNTGSSLAAAHVTSAVPPQAREAATSLAELLAGLAKLEEQFRSSGDALAASAQPTPPESLLPAPASASAAPHVFATLDALATAAARCDAEVGQQLAVLRRGVAALTQDLSAIVERCPRLAANSGSTGAANAPSASPSMTALSRTPQIGATPASGPAVSPAVRAATSGDAGASSSHGPPPLSSPPPSRRSSNATPAVTPNQQPVVSRSPSLHGSPATPAPVRTASSTTRLSGAAVGAPGSPLLGLSTAERAEPPLPAALLPTTACTEDVKRYLGCCVEWPPRPRAAPTPPSPPPPHHPSGAGATAWQRGATAERQRTSSSGSPLPKRIHVAGRSPGSDAAPADLMGRRGSETDEFLRRLTEESPYDLSMLRSPASHSRDSPLASSAHTGSDAGSSSSAGGDDYDLGLDEEQRPQQRRLSASGSAGRRVAGAPAITAAATAAAGKRNRSHGAGHHATPTRHTPRQRTQSAKPDADAMPPVLRRVGRPTVQDSVDALVLAQLRADGIALPAAMAAELGWRGPPSSAAGNADVAAASADAAAVPMARAVPVKLAARRAEDGDRSSTATAHLGVATGCDVGGDDEADFAVVLQEVRALVRHRDLGAAAARAATASRPTPERPYTELARVALQLAARLPTASSWLAEMMEFCRLLDDMAAAAAALATRSNADGAESRSDEGRASGGGGAVAFAARSSTPTTSRTRERVSPAAKRLSGTATSPSSSASATQRTASVSDTAAAASASDFSAVADELFSSAEEAEEAEEDGGDSAEEAPGRGARAPAPVSGGPAARVPPVSDAVSLEHSLSIVRPSTHGSQSSSATPSSFRDTSRSAEPRLGEGTAVGEETEEVVPTWRWAGRPVRRLSMPAEELWLSFAGVPKSHHGAGAFARLSASASPRAAGGRGAAPLSATPSSCPLSAAQRPLLSRQQQQQQQRVLTPGARALAERHRTAPEAHPTHRRRETLWQRQEALLRRRCVRVRVESPTPAELPPTRRAESEVPTADAAAATALPWAPGNAAAVMDHRAAAEHLRVLCALLQTDLTIVCVLQELSAPAPSLAADATPPPAHSTSDAFAAATRLLLSLKQHRELQARALQEAQLQLGSGNAGSVKTSAAPLTSIADSSPSAQANGSKTSAETASLAGAAAPLMVSVQHPMSALGYTPTLSRVLSTAVDGLLSRDLNGAAGPPHEEAQLARYLVTVAPYLLAWQTCPDAAMTAAPAAGAAGVSAATTTETPGGASAFSASLSTAPPGASPTLPLPVWVYLESLTTAIVEEARKVHAMYELYVRLVAEETLQSHGRVAADGAAATSAAAAAASAAAAMATIAFSLPPLWHGGTDETLMSFVRRRGRAAAVALGRGVVGAAAALDNGLEKFVTPVSAHLLHSFDELERRHLLHNVFQEVHLSDVVARRRARLEFLSRASPAARRRSPSGTGAAGAEDDERLDSFALPPGTLSSPAMRGASHSHWSMRDAEQQRTSPGRNSGDDDGSGAAPPSPAQRRGDSDGDTTPQRRGRATARRLMSISGSGETRHTIIEGFVRYLTGGERRRSSAAGADGSGGSPSHGAGAAADAGSPSHQRGSPQPASPQPQNHHHSGLTLDVPHTSALLHEMDALLETGTSNIALIQDVERRLRATALADAAEVGRTLSKRHYFNAHAAAFTTRHVLPACASACVSVVHCRWQPVFQSTMCFCLVTRRRCLDPLVCGALLICATLPPQKIFYSAPDPSLGSTPLHGISRAMADGAGVAGAGAGAPGGTNRPLPSTIRALRSRFERSSEPIAAVSPRPSTAASATPSPRPEQLQQQRQQQQQQQPLAGVPGLDEVEFHEAMRAAMLGAPLTPLQQQYLIHVQLQQLRQQQAQPQSSPMPQPTLPTPARLGPALSLFPHFLLRGPSMMPDGMAIPRILTRTATALYADSAVAANNGDEERDEVRTDDAATSAGARASAAAAMSDEAFRALRAVTVPLETPPITRNLLASPDRAQAAFLNPPTLLECGHIVSHKTYLDLRTAARRPNRNMPTAAVGTTTVVCCPYCSKVTPAKDAVTLSYLY